MNDHCILCGLPVSRATTKQALDGLLDRLVRGEGAWLLTLNTEMLARFTRDPGYWDMVARADIITADGMPLVWASKARGASQVIPERTTGVDLVDAFLRLPELPAYAIIGGQDPATTVATYGGTAQQACRYLFNGKVDLSDDQVQEFVGKLREHRVRWVFVALNVPRGDRLALKIKTQMPELVIIAVGGSFEILGPRGGRAPKWMQKMGLEWFFRLMKEPGRLWKRYLIHYPAGIGLLLRDSFSPLPRRPPR
ncbi:WecB/TagA/CpsF family glycosyltransferase [Hydrogenophaga sp. RWCD_12]|uniref:WecB/TagA/CpsF family glycosyltransferase n=1 Tax=Hydrogenophaga sp. RWCD_12 TaxID=3391190 RepID=UPI003984B7F4